MSELHLGNGSKVAVIGGGPAGSFFSYFLLQLAQRLDLNLQVDIYEPRDYTVPGPQGCNMCAGIISESLVQLLATEGINLPSIIVQRGIENYVLYTSKGKTRIRTATDEQRIAAVFRGAGPRDLTESTWRSFDGYLLELAVSKGALHKQEKVKGVRWNQGRLELSTSGGNSQVYDLAVVAAGLNSSTLKIFDGLGLKYKPPQSIRSHLREYKLGKEKVEKYLGVNVHVFLLNLPGLEFGAIVPKESYATLCLVGYGIDDNLVRSFLSDPLVKGCLPPDTKPEGSCRCFPPAYFRAAIEPFADRIVFIGDSSASRLFKDGIGAAYRTSKAAATTAILQGVSANDFRRHYFPICKRIESDNQIGRVVFAVNSAIKKRSYALGGLVRMVNREQQDARARKRMSGVVWDTFTGSAPYKDIFKRTLHPLFVMRYLSDIAAEVWPIRRRRQRSLT